MRRALATKGLFNLENKRMENKHGSGTKTSWRGNVGDLHRTRTLGHGRRRRSTSLLLTLPSAVSRSLRSLVPGGGKTTVGNNRNPVRIGVTRPPEQPSSPGLCPVFGPAIRHGLKKDWI
ncbi:hypothetical protein J6590_027030 [Homalodisca vitripennis]|nr:hypothetical protein J6590_027030 [Homalodisca vitripennis]